MSDSTDDVALGKRVLLRHAVATLAYRGAKAIRNAPPALADFRAGDVTRTPVQLLAHLGDLLDWALSLAEGNQRWRVATPAPWEDESSAILLGTRSIRPVPRERSALSAANRRICFRVRSPTR